jgi:DNA invertase Pin-like site-specific DNA recombinase
MIQSSQSEGGARLVAYYRVSTARQGVSGLGLEAQERAVRDYAARVGGEIIAEYTDVETGKHRRRAGLEKALADACRKGRVLIFYSLTRLGRSTIDVLQISQQIQQAGADMVCVTEAIDTTTPAGRMFFGVLAVLGQFERELISERTKAGLASRRARGLPMGNPSSLRRGHSPAIEQNRAMADEFAARMRPIVADIQAGGHTSAKEIASQLNARGYHAAGGGLWHPTTAARLLARLG